ncbi:transcriptional regulator [Staphylococcus saprophyticus]|nr:transcriptional regulator [Staphylococcus saprophyticus]
MLQLTPNFDIQSKDPIYIQLYSYIKQEIKKKRLLPEMKLPSNENFLSIFVLVKILLNLPMGN